MKNIFISLLVIILIAPAALSQSREERHEKDFTAVAFGAPGTCTVETGSAFSVVLRGDRDLLDDIETYVRNGKLYIRKDNWTFARNKSLEAHVIMPEIEGLSVSGSGHLYTKGNVECDDLYLAVSGSGNIDIEHLSADEMDISVSGSGSVDIEGQGADMAEISVSGSGDVDVSVFRVDVVEVNISGSGSCNVWAEERLEARVSGSGDIYYKGNPNIDARTSGSGRIRKF